MKKQLAIVICAVIAFSLTACASKKRIGSDASNKASVEIRNPFVDCETLADAIGQAGFELTVPETIHGVAPRFYRVMTLGGRMLEVIYQADENEIARIRKASGTRDISGDYNGYAQTSIVVVGQVEVTIRGNDEKFCLATWTAEGYSYAVYLANGVSRVDMMAVVSGIY